MGCNHASCRSELCLRGCLSRHQLTGPPCYQRGGPATPPFAGGVGNSVNILYQAAEDYDSVIISTS